MFKLPEENRKKGSPYYENGGVFEYKRGNLLFFIIAASGFGWEHVSVTIKNTKEEKQRCPSWNEMCQVKDLFWEKNDWVVQYHPAEEDYVNNHSYCLHLWKPTEMTLPTPPSLMVGIKTDKIHG